MKLIQTPDCDSRCPALLDWFLSFDASICSTKVPPLGNSNYAVVSVSFDFPLNSKWDASFCSTAYDYSCHEWDFLRDYLEMVYRKISSTKYPASAKILNILLNILLLPLLVNFVKRFRLVLMNISLTVSIKASLSHLHCFQSLVLLS